VAQPEASTKALDGDRHDEAKCGILERAAAKGSLATQMALAYAYLARSAQPDDVVNACMWYLVASERSSQLRSLTATKLTPEQMHEARQRANVRLVHQRRPSDPQREAFSETGPPKGQGYGLRLAAWIGPRFERRKLAKAEFFEVPTSDWPFGRWRHVPRASTVILPLVPD